jgi:hypothetical protein
MDADYIATLRKAIYKTEDVNSLEEPIVSSTFCDRCLSCITYLSEFHTKAPYRDVNDVITNQFTFKHHECLPELKRSGLAGCHMCSLLCTLAPAQRAYWQPSETESEVYITGTYGLQAKFENSGFASISVEIDGADTASEFVNLLAWREKPMSTLMPLLSWSTSSQACLELAASWLNNCREHHDVCHIDNATGILPRRLLDITFVGNDICVRLVSSTIVSADWRYVTLSHCWGRRPPLKLLQSNLCTFEAAIPIHSLPKTFLDAVFVTVALGFRYLWIDALCIIQDLESDWQDQIPQMGSIYRLSELTIAALYARDGSQGCFSTRNPLQHSTCQVQVTDKEWYIEAPTDTWQHYSPTKHFDGELPALHTRGWVVQERAMTPRTLFFGENMIYWECIECIASELNPIFENVREVATKNASKGIYSQHRGGSKLNEDKAISRAIASWGGLKTVVGHLSEPRINRGPFWRWQPFWNRIVEEYTECSLTFARDKWPAISALAAHVENMVGEKLVHGLWRNHLASELQWRCFEEAKRTDSGFPSWSWLFIEGPISARNTEIESSRLRNLEDTANAWVDSGNDRIVVVQAPSLQFASVLPEDSKREYVIHEADDTSLEKGLWTADYAMPKPRETWALQFQTVVQHDRAGKTCRTYMGLVVIPHPETDDLWLRVGHYVFKMPPATEELQQRRNLGQIRTFRLA